MIWENMNCGCIELCSCVPCSFLRICVTKYLTMLEESNSHIAITCVVSTCISESLDSWVWKVDLQNIFIVTNHKNGRRKSSRTP